MASSTVLSAEAKVPKYGFNEYVWAFCHPLKVGKAYRISKLVGEITDSIEVNSILTGRSGGNLDAFKHCLWSSMLTNQLGPRAAKKLCEAHESANFKSFKRGKSNSSYEHSLMDSLNNNIGLSIFVELQENEIRILVDSAITLLKTGSLTCLSIDELGNYLDCKGNIIVDDKLWKRNICLVATKLN